MISIVVPAFNAATTIGDQLGALAAQGEGVDWEVIVADNGSVDETAPVVAGWTHRLPVRVVDASARSGPAAARNIGAAVAGGDVLGFTDADDVVQPGWVAAVAAYQDPGGIATGPISRFDEGDPVPQATNGAGGPPRHMGFLAYAFGTNTVVSRSAFERAGGFSETFRTGEDVDLSWRIQCGGEELSFLRGAGVSVRVRSGASGVFGQYLSYGRGDVQLYERYRPQGCPRPSVLPTMKSYAGLVARIPLLFDPRHRLAWLHQLGRRTGRIIGSFERRVFYP